MACPTCDHTMQNIGSAFWCPRCGTIKTLGDMEESRPMLVDRCRTFERNALPGFSLQQNVWHSLGIDEAINLPDERPEQT